MWRTVRPVFCRFFAAFAANLDAKTIPVNAQRTYSPRVDAAITSRLIAVAAAAVGGVIGLVFGRLGRRTASDFLGRSGRDTECRQHERARAVFVSH